MKFTIKHEIRGRIRIHNCQKTMSADQADELQYYLITKDFVTSVKIYDRTNDIVICYDASRSEILTALRNFIMESSQSLIIIKKVRADN